ncbi:hypothetical protein KY284_008041 [Solanum tuberosum]|nr:hypothetical protein KY284_008041 [Solanum tuberosum]
MQLVLACSPEEDSWNESGNFIFEGSDFVPPSTVLGGGVEELGAIVVPRRVLDAYESGKNSLHTPEDIAKCRFVPCDRLFLEEANNFVKGIGVVKKIFNNALERWMPTPHEFHSEELVIGIDNTVLEINKKWEVVRFGYG